MNSHLVDNSHGGANLRQTFAAQRPAGYTLLAEVMPNF